MVSSLRSARQALPDDIDGYRRRPRQSDPHRENPYCRRPRKRRLGQLRRSTRRQTVASRLAAQRRKIAAPEVAIDAEIDRHVAGGENFISARFNVVPPDLDREIARSSIEDAGQLCTHSKATRGNIDVVFNLV